MATETIVTSGPFNIFSVPGILWANVMANGIAVKVMLWIFGGIGVILLSVWLYKRVTRDPDEIVT